MPWCPRCRYEYVAGVEKCPDCGAALVSELPPLPPPETTPLELITVFATYDPGMVALARSILDGVGIRYLARNEALRRCDGYPMLAISDPVGPVMFQVTPEDALAARELLQHLENRDPGEPESLEE